MIEIQELRRRYKKIILWGFVEKHIKKYVDYMDYKQDYIIDTDVDKQGISYKGIKIKKPSDILEENENEIAVIILPIYKDNSIYSYLKKKSFSCDFFLDNCVVIDRKKTLYQDDYFYYSDGNYSSEKHLQIVVFLLKAYGIKKIITSPGTLNIPFIYSVQSDPFFEVYSCIDERSAAYMACGMAQTTREIIVLSCTGATASRNYLSGLTEAYYGALPIIVITSSQKSYKIDNEVEQVTDRSKMLPDVVKKTEEISHIYNEEDRKYCELRINKLINSIIYGERKPVHINLITDLNYNTGIKTLPLCKMIKVVSNKDFPVLYGKIGVYIKTHYYDWDEETVNAITTFCEKYNAVIFGDHLSNYTGKYFIQAPLIFRQKQSESELDILICFGEMNYRLDIPTKEVWRIAENDIIRDPDLKLSYYFKMKVIDFFTEYNQINKLPLDNNKSLRNVYENKYIELYKRIDNLPFSNAWIAKETITKIPRSSTVYYGISSSLRVWNYFKKDPSIKCYSTVGGFGIDGTMSSMIGASIIDRKQLYFCFLGDLSFFYDINSLGNRHIGKNIRIMCFNNNGGNQMLYQNGLNDKDAFMDNIAAFGHFVSKEKSLIKSYVEALGFKYFLAENKESFLEKLPIFVGSNLENSIVFEIKYDGKNDIEAQNIITALHEVEKKYD